MKNFINKLRNKYVMLAIGFLTAISAFGGSSVLVFSANCSGTVPTTPVFNYWPLTYNSSELCHDLPLIDARNLSSSTERDARYSASQSEHDAGINATTGDTVRVSIYFHNGATDDESYRSQTTAHDVTIGSTFSTDATATHSIAGSLSASNVATVTSSSDHQGGAIAIHTSDPTTLQYVPGSTQMCIQYAAAQERGADMTQTCGTDAQGQPKILIDLPDGIANGSVNIGDLKSCFLYSGEVVYSVKVVGSVIQPTNPSLSITKQVEDLTTSTGYSSSVTANQNDSVQYKISVTNTGDATANSVVITDPGTSGTTVTSGQMTNGSYTLGNLSAGQTSTIIYDANVNASSGTFTNTATATASNTSSVQASATINVNGIVNTCSYLTTNELVKDLTQGNSNYSNQVYANSGDTVSFQITIANPSANSVAQNLNISQSLSSGLNYVSGSATLNGSYYGNSFINNTLNLGTLSAGSTDTFIFQATVGSYNNYNTGTTLSNSVNINSSCGSQSASSTVIVNGQTPIIPINTYGQLSITKYVRDITYGNTLQKTINAYPNDQVQYQITVGNTGTGSLSNVVVNDNLPAGVTYSTASLANGNYAGNGNVYIGSLYPGQQVVITINATVNGTAGQTIQNTASASATNAQTVYDSAMVYISGVAGNSTNLTFFKSAFNNTKNVDATSVAANKDDYITYTLTTTNSGNTVANNFQVTDDLSGVLNYASIVNLNGGTMNGNTISWPAVTIATGTSVNETFEVRVNYNLPSSYNSLQLVNTYGNIVTIQINNPKVLGAAIVAPTTGPASEAAYSLGFASLVTLMFYFLRKRHVSLS
jgi:uncharacterized repeat protein (TIGR01451 family)